MVQGVLPGLTVACVRDAIDEVVGFVAVTDDEVNMLFIHPVWRGQGVGRRLLKYTMEIHGATALDVNEQNDQAIGFYLRMGFEVVGRSALDGTGKPYPILHMRLAANK